MKDKAPEVSVSLFSTHTLTQTFNKSIGYYVNIQLEARFGQICGGCNEMFLCACVSVHLQAANIVIQTEPATTASTPGSNVSRFNTEQDNRKRTMGSSTAEGPAAKKPWMEK